MSRGVPCSFRRKLGSREENYGGAKLTAKRDKNNEHFQTYFIFGISIRNVGSFI